jgi:uncharacterized protein (TIGR00251 family)
VSPLRLRPTAGGVRVTVRVQPRASRNELSGVHGDALKVRLTAPPVEGAANEALVEFLAATFGVPTRAVTIVAGTSSRTKVVELAGITEDRVRRLMHL